LGPITLSTRTVKGNDHADDEARLPASTIVTYGLPQLGTGAMFGMLLLYFLKFSTDTLLIAPAVIGTVLGVSRVWDAISDPIAGYFSDLTRSRLGRRRPWILVAAVPIGISFFALWSPPGYLTGGWLTTWMVVWIFIFFSVYTMYVVPHKALGAELGAGYHDRTRVFATSSFFGYCGAFFAIGGVFMLERSATPRLTAMGLAMTAALLTSAAMIFTALRVREQGGHQGRFSPRGAQPLSGSGNQTPWTVPSRERRVTQFSRHRGATYRSGGSNGRGADSRGLSCSAPA